MDETAHIVRWSDFRYVLDLKEDCKGKEAIQALSLPSIGTRSGDWVPTHVCFVPYLRPPNTRSTAFMTGTLKFFSSEQ